MFKGMFKTALRGLVFGAALFLGVLALPLTYAATIATISTYTGPAGSNPIAFPADLADVNGLMASVNTVVTAMNNAVFSFVTFNQANEANEMAFLNSGTFVGASNCSLAAANQCLVVVQPNGRQGYIVVE